MSRAETTPIRPLVSIRAGVGRVIQSDIFNALIAANVVAAAVILLYVYAWLQPLDLAVYDVLRVAWAGRAAASPVVVIGANESDIGRWGWPLHDEDLANILERLLAWKPRAIGVDLYRDRPVPPGSNRLSALLAAHPEIFWSFKLQEGSHAAIPAPQAVRGTERAVLADTLVDSDGVVRRGLLYADDGTTNYPGIGTALALAYLSGEGIHLGAAPDDRAKAHQF